MDRYDYLVIGGGIAGVSAAETIREHDADCTIAVLSDEPHILYSRVLLPSYLKGGIPRERVFLRTRGDFEKKRIDLFLGEEVTAVDAQKHEIRTDKSTTIYWRKLLIAAGGRTAPWGKKEEQKYIYRLQTLDDADRIIAAMPAIHDPIVIGSSFIALEFLEVFASHGLVPKLLMRGPYFFSSMLDGTGGAFLADHFAAHGIAVHGNDSIARTEEEEGMLAITTHAGAAMRTNALAVATGIERNRGFLKNSGVALGKKGIQVNEFLETTVTDVFAAGDIAELYDPASDTGRTTGNWTNAVLQGKHAGLAMTGIQKPFAAIPTYSITNFGLQFTVLGECDNALDAITRQDPARHAYERFFMSGNAMVGTIMINWLQDRTHLASLIAQKINVSKWRTSLHDPAFDIHAIPLIK